MTAESALADAWPLFGLRLAHGDLLLRVVRDADALALGRILHRVLAEDEAHFMPNVSRQAVADTEAETVRRSVQYHWGLRAGLRVSSWALPFAVVHEGQVVGCQDLRADDFAVLRQVDTGSYLAPDRRGHGLGTRVRAMVLDLAFTHLGASTASSSYIEGNEASRRVSQRLGYEPDGLSLMEFRGRRLRDHRMRVDAQRWAEVRPEWLDDVTVAGVEAVRPLLGAP
ncbi:MAG: GNAT family protein [Kineosporiaceae bacterium]